MTSELEIKSGARDSKGLPCLLSLPFPCQLDGSPTKLSHHTCHRRRGNCLHALLRHSFLRTSAARSRDVVPSLPSSMRKDSATAERWRP